ncbi:MAG: hypothetical protein IPM54_30970 [Polyangiaceae bacterium]|nr:hypothetical protein [Polyangiaceae bacterium]
MGLLVGAGGCAEITDANAPYTLTESSSSSGGAGGGDTGGMGGMGGSGIQCATDADCPATGQVCTVPACIDGTCGTRNALNGTPADTTVQKVGDCKIIVCDGLGGTKAIHDDTDVPDDANPCTIDTCENGAPKMTNVPADTLASPTLQQPGDCKKVICDGMGGQKTVIDDTDMPDDGNQCTIDTCSNGAPLMTNVDVNTPCGLNQKCNASGQCGCMKIADCDNTYSFCKQRSCNAGVCGIEYLEVDTPLPASDQIVGDCKVDVCDGDGNVLTKVDENDVPVDGNECTQDKCNSDGTPSNPLAPLLAPCILGDNDVCDGFGACKKSNGKPCAGGDECVTGICMDGFCCDTACDDTCKSCGVAGKLGTCANIPLGSIDGNATMTCAGANVCNGAGLCKLANGQSCTSDSQCASGNCKNGQNKCQP